MSSPNTHADGNILHPRDLPPYAPGKPYVISSQDGEIIYIPLSKSATRLLVTGKETEDAFAVVGSGGSQGDPIGFHYHREAHDVFLCLKGAINVWAGEKCRTMGPGDFASVPPNVIHQYQILGDHSEMMGLIVPGGWEEFFRFIGEPYSGPTWPLHDDRNFFEVLLPKLKAAAEKFDMVPCPQQKPFDPQPWQGDDNLLPGKAEAYFLKNATGPAYLCGGMLSRPLVTTAESNGKFAIGSIEGSSQHHSSSMFAKEDQTMDFADVHHAFLIADGSVEFQIETASSRLHASELVYVPKATRFRFRVISRSAKIYAFCNGPGIVELLRELGRDYDEPVIPEKAEPVDFSKLNPLVSSFGGIKVGE